MNRFTANEEFEKKWKKLLASDEAILKQVHDLNQKIREAFAELPKSSKILADYGWYIQNNMTPGLINGLAAMIQNGEIEDVNQRFIKYYDEHIDRIMERLILDYPKRSNVLTASINAHLKGEYYLSTPVFFAQAEGIYIETLRVKYFSQSGPKQLMKLVGDKYTGKLRELLLEPLMHVGVNRKQTGMDEAPIGENRHDILHGKSFDYGDDPLNSYKALSFLVYICEELPDLKTSN